jgi:hypothetical protein
MEHAVKLNVDGESQQVKLKEIVHPIHSMFLVSFEDGYENIFFVDVESGKWVEQDMGFTNLATLIGKKINHFYHLDTMKKTVTWCQERDDFDNLIEFGYHQDTSGGYLVYEIFAPNRRYMFTLVRLHNHVWQLFKIPGSGWDYDQNYVQKVPFILDDMDQ